VSVWYSALALPQPAPSTGLAGKLKGETFPPSLSHEEILIQVAATRLQPLVTSSLTRPWVPGFVSVAGSNVLPETLQSSVFVPLSQVPGRTLCGDRGRVGVSLAADVLPVPFHPSPN